MENSYGGITCTEVRDSLPQMVSGKAEESLVAKINAHLAECPRCAEMARKMKEQDMHAAAGRTSAVSGVQQHSAATCQRHSVGNRRQRHDESSKARVPGVNRGPFAFNAVGLKQMSAAAELMNSVRNLKALNH